MDSDIEKSILKLHSKPSKRKKTRHAPRSHIDSRPDGHVVSPSRLFIRGEIVWWPLEGIDWPCWVLSHSYLFFSHPQHSKRCALCAAGLGRGLGSRTRRGGAQTVKGTFYGSAGACSAAGRAGHASAARGTAGPSFSHHHPRLSTRSFRPHTPVSALALFFAKKEGARAAARAIAKGDCLGLGSRRGASWRLADWRRRASFSFLYSAAWRRGASLSRLAPRPSACTLHRRFASFSRSRPHPFRL